MLVLGLFVCLVNIKSDNPPLPFDTPVTGMVWVSLIMSSARWLSAASDHCCVRPLVPGLLPLMHVFKIRCMYFILYSYCIVCILIEFILFPCIPFSLFVYPAVSLSPMAWYVCAVAFLPHALCAQIIQKTSLQNTIRRFYIVNWGKEQETQGLILDVATAA